MLKGFIKTRHILFHPITLISNWGVKGYFKMLIKCFDKKKHGFTDFLSL